jgi:N,N-dimethylformamidase beta subunit-like, C-terminal
MRRALLPLLAAGLLAPRAQAATAPLEAYFSGRSAAPSHGATLHVYTRARTFTLRISRAGTGRALTGAPVTATSIVTHGPGWSTVRVRLGDWPSGLYFARVQTSGGHVAYAPIVVRGRGARVAVVMPTNTWQAYNFRDADHDGVGDTWYASPRIHAVQLARPYAHDGVPPHFGTYDAGFERWLVRGDRPADFLSDDDLARIPSARRLARRYDLVVFPGHEEYVTAHAYDLIEGYVARGGNLMLLSANDFFSRVDRVGSRIVRVGRWRDLGRPESAWIGSQYLDWFQNRFRNRPYRVVDAAAAPWLFAGTGLHDGSTFGSYGIEIDATTALTPPGTHVLARISDVFGRGRSAEMIYRETRGARVFAAGAIDFGGSASQPVPAKLLDNLWNRVSRP